MVACAKKKLRQLQLLKDFTCVVTSTWARPVGKLHTRRGWPKREEKTDCFVMGPRDLQLQTWYSNKARLRNWDRPPVVMKIEGKELKVMKGKKAAQGGFRSLKKKNRSSRTES